MDGRCTRLGYKIKGTHVYLDDIIYATKTWEEHLLLLEQAFKRLHENKVYLHPLKCEWAVLSIEYLGLRVSHNHVQITDEKIAAIEAYTEPDSYPAVRRFLGFAQYLAHFIPHYATTAAVISDLLKGADTKKKFIWPLACSVAFKRICKELIQSVGLAMPDKEGDLVVETDASGLGVGACLYQFIDDKLVPIWYLSKKFSSAEANYSTRDREALAVIYALNKF